MARVVRFAKVFSCRMGHGLSLSFALFSAARLGYLLLFLALLFSIMNEKRLGLLVVSAMSALALVWRGHRSLASFGVNLFGVRNAMRLMLARLLAIGLLALGAHFVPSLTEGFSL